MPMRWTISHDERLVMVTADGPVTLLEIEAYFDALVLAGAQPYGKLLDATTMEARLSDADSAGVALLEKLEIRADGIASFFEQMLAKEPKDSAAIAGIWSSHPPTNERIEATRRPSAGKPPFTDAEWKAIRNVCK